MMIIHRNGIGAVLDGWDSADELAIAIVRNEVVFEIGDRIDIEPDLDDKADEPEITGMMEG